jgi:hypothetical protein
MWHKAQNSEQIIQSRDQKGEKREKRLQTRDFAKSRHFGGYPMFLSAMLQIEPKFCLLASLLPTLHCCRRSDTPLAYLMLLVHLDPLSLILPLRIIGLHAVASADASLLPMHFPLLASLLPIACSLNNVLDIQALYQLAF